MVIGTSHDKPLSVMGSQSRGGMVAFVEKLEQADAGIQAFPDATIVAMTAPLDYWLEQKGRTDPTIEDLYDDIEIYAIADGLTDRLESLASYTDNISKGLLESLDPYGDVSLRAFFHYLKVNFDSLVIRIEQIFRAIDKLQPKSLMVFQPSVWARQGLDRPTLGLTTQLLPHIAEKCDIETLVVPICEKINRESEQIAQKNKQFHERLFNKIKQVSKICRELIGFWPLLTFNRKPLLLHGISPDFGNSLIEKWTSDGGLALNLGRWLRLFGTPEPDAEAVAKCMQLYYVLEHDSVFRNYFRYRKIDLWPWLGPLVKYFIKERYPVLLRELCRSDKAFRHKQLVILTGGMVDTNYIYGRISDRHKVPMFSYHHGSWIGYAKCPLHERFDMAECDYLVCGGVAAAEALEKPSILSHWRLQTKRAKPLSVGFNWAQELMRRYRTSQLLNRPIKRVMVVLNSLNGDYRYLSYAMPPEIQYWRFTRRVVAELAKNQLEIIVKPPLSYRYPQLVSPLEHWIDRQDFKNVTILRDVPLGECLDIADAFVLESPNSPLISVVATQAVIFLYINRHYYRLLDHASSALARRCAIFAEEEADFFRKLDIYLRSSVLGEDMTPSLVDDTFLHSFVVPASSDVNENLCKSLRLAARNYLVESNSDHSAPFFSIR